MDEIETIVGVAIVVKGVVHQLPKPNRHHNCIHMVFEQTKKGVATESQGFITSTGRYVDREEGLKVALAANQVLELNRKGFPYKRHHKTELFSEDLW